MSLKMLSRGTICRLLSTSATRCSVEAATATKRDDYYKNLGAQDQDVKPAGWDEALPYEAIPGPKPLPLIGNTWRFLPGIGEYHHLPVEEFYKGLRKKYGDILSMRGFYGRRPTVVLFDCNDVETALRNAGAYPIRNNLESFVYYRTTLKKDVFKGVGGVLTVHGEDWFKFRSIANPILMQPRVIQQYVGKMDEVASELIENIRHFSKQNKDSEMPENFIYELYKWSLESVGLVALNKRLGCLDLNLKEGSEGRRFISSAIDSLDALYYLEVLPPLWKAVNTPSFKKLVKTQDYITETSLKYIEECLAEEVDSSVPEQELGVLQRLVKVNKQFAIAMVTDMLLAGIDTTGKTLGAALYYLAKNPDKQECLREELLRNLPRKDSPVTKEILNNSPYLTAAIKETMRMAPVALGNIRTSTKDLVLGGYRVPKNTDIVGIHLPSIVEERFKEAEKFYPERYLRSENDEYSAKNAHPFASLPFGHGARSCVGQRLAILELEVALSRIIRNFRVSWPHEDMKFAAKFLYGIASPLKLRMKPVQE